MQKSRRFWCQGNPISVQAFGGFAGGATAGKGVQEQVAQQSGKAKGSSLKAKVGRKSGAGRKSESERQKDPELRDALGRAMATGSAAEQA